MVLAKLLSYCGFGKPVFEATGQCGTYNLVNVFGRGVCGVGPVFEACTRHCNVVLGPSCGFGKPVCEATGQGGWFVMGVKLTCVRTLAIAIVWCRVDDRVQSPVNCRIIGKSRGTEFSSYDPSSSPAGLATDP